MTLGCASYDAFVLERGGRQMVGGLPWSSLRWSRTLDEVSTAEVVMAGTAYECSEALRGFHPYQHELAIRRGSDLTWVGPIVAKGWQAGPESDSAQMSARDLMQWPRRRRLHQDHDYVEVDLATIFRRVINDAMSVDNSPRLSIATTATGVLGTRRWKANQYRMAGDLVSELSRTALDWTVIDRTVIAGPTEIDQAPIATLGDQSFIDFESVSEDGAALVTSQVVIGDGFGEAGATILGSATSTTSATYGVHEATLTAGDIRDDASATRLARSIVDLGKKPLVGFTGGRLAPECSLSVEDLVPGRAVQLSLRSIGVYGIYRLVMVEGSVGPEHDDIRITVEPIGSTKLRVTGWNSGLDATQ